MKSQVILVVFIACQGLSLATCTDSTTILLSVNGFPWNTFLDPNLRNIHRLVKEGVVAEKGMLASYPTEEYPNLITLVTGLYPESHGVIGSSIYDPVLKKKVHASRKSAALFHNFEPIWITNERNSSNIDSSHRNRTRKSAVIHWTGSTFTYNGKYTFNHTKTRRVKKNKLYFNKILKLLRSGNPPNFLLCHFNYWRRLWYKFGPHSSYIRNITIDFDRALGNFISKLKKMKVYNQTNIILVSDHSVVKVNSKKTIGLQNFLQYKWLDYIRYGASVYVWPKDNFFNITYKRLLKLKHAKVYLKKEIPERLHFRKHRQIPPILVIADNGWIIEKHSHQQKYLGMRGYDNSLPEMKTLFVARGPAFKQGYKKDTFANVDIYPLMCHLLNITPRPNNGSLDTLKDILKIQKNNKTVDVKSYVKNTEGGHKIVLKALLIFLVPSGGIVFLVFFLVYKETKKIRTTYVNADIEYSALQQQEEQQCNERGPNQLNVLFQTPMM